MEQTSQTPTTTPQEPTVEKKEETSSMPKTLERVANYEVVSNISQAAKSLYETTKTYAPVIQTVENNIGSALTWVKPKLDPVLQSETFQKVDQFGVKQLETLEKLPETISESFKSHKENIETKVSDMTISTKKEVEKQVTNMDTYLKDSILNAPIERAIGIAERLSDKYLGEQKVVVVTIETNETETIVESDTTTTPVEKTETPTNTDGPLLHAGKVGKKIQEQAVEKLKKLATVTSNDNFKKVEYLQALLTNATTNLENSMRMANEFAEKSSGVVSEKATQLKTNLRATTVDALVTVVLAAEEITKNTKDFSQKNYKLLQEKVAQYTPNLDSIKDITIFSTVTTASLQKLQDAKKMLSDQNTLPGNVVATISATVQSILDSFFSLANNASTTTITTTTTSQG